MKQLLNEYIDHTLLNPQAVESDFLKLIEEGVQFKFASLCVPPSQVALVSEVLKSHTVKTCTVIGFPLGYSLTKTKVQETAHVVKAGAEEVDMVINIGLLKNKSYKKLEEEIRSIKSECPLLKVILETALLTEEEIVKSTQIAIQAGADFVKTSTGFSTRGATLKDIEIMKKAAADWGPIQIKASGGISSVNDALNFIAAGATRLGTSRGVLLMKQATMRESADLT